jgi:hypothetical protein
VGEFQKATSGLSTSEAAKKSAREVLEVRKQDPSFNIITDGALEITLAASFEPLPAEHIMAATALIALSCTRLQY